jgi:hypothetical protein
MAAIKHASGYLQRLVARELSIRHCPELRFAIDEAAKSARKTMELLEDNRRAHPELYEPEADAGNEPVDRITPPGPAGEPPTEATRELDE